MRRARQIRPLLPDFRGVGRAAKAQGLCAGQSLRQKLETREESVTSPNI